MEACNLIPTPLEVIRNPAPLLIVGLIDDSNIHLDGLYGIYRKMLNKGLIGKNDNSAEIECTCELIKTNQLTTFILEYLIDVTVKHFGTKSFEIPEPKFNHYGLERIQVPAFQPPNDLASIRRLLERENIPRLDHPDDVYNGWPPIPQQEANIINFQEYLQNKRNREQL